MAALLSENGLDLLPLRDPETETTVEVDIGEPGGSGGNWSPEPEGVAVPEPRSGAEPSEPGGTARLAAPEPD